MEIFFSLIKERKFILAEALYAVLCVIRFWDRAMVEHAVPVPILGNYFVMILITALYFGAVLLFSAWVLSRSEENNRRFLLYLLTLLVVLLFPAFLSENYFGAPDPICIMVYMEIFTVLAKKRQHPILPAVTFVILSLVTLPDATEELTLLRFAIIAVFFVGIVIYFVRRYGNHFLLWMGAPAGVVWSLLKDYDRGLLYFMLGAAFGLLYLTLAGDAIWKAKMADVQKDAEKKPLFWPVVLACIVLFVIFWMYGEPLLLEEEILEY